MLSEWLLAAGGLLLEASPIARWCIAACIFTASASCIACLVRFEPQVERTFWIGALLLLPGLAVLFSQKPVIPVLVSAVPDTTHSFAPIGIAWAIGTVVFAAVLTVRLAVLSRWIGCLPPYVGNLPLEIPAGVNIRVARETTPFAFGLLHPSIVLPPSFGQWPGDVQRLVLMHELTHVRRHDWLWLLLATAATTVLWFWPWAWVFRARLERRIEESCDQSVAASSGNVEAYVKALVETAQRCRAQPPCHVAPVAQRLEARVGRLLRAHQLNPPVDPEARVFWPLALPAMAATILGSATLMEPVQERNASARFAAAPFHVVVQSPESDAPSESNGKEMVCVGPNRVPVIPEPPPSGGPPSPASASSYHGDVQVTPPPVLDAAVAPASNSPLLSRTPDYPRHARERGLEGEVTIEFDVNAAGYVGNVRVVKSDPEGVFETAAVTALRDFRFPRSHNGTTRKGMRQSFVFQLQSRT
jgi:TonB family protein